MGFSVWAWRDSTVSIFHAQGWGYRVDARDSGVAIIGADRPSGGFHVERMDMSGGRPWVMRLARPGFVKWKEPAPTPEILGSGPVDQALQSHVRSALFQNWLVSWGGRRGGWVCFIPYWLILLGAAVVWGALLGWRTRRWRRAQEAGRETTVNLVG